MDGAQAASSAAPSSGAPDPEYRPRQHVRSFRWILSVGLVGTSRWCRAVRTTPPAASRAVRARSASTSPSRRTSASLRSPPESLEHPRAGVEVVTGGLGQDPDHPAVQLRVLGDHAGHQVGVGVPEPDHGRGGERVEHQLLGGAGLHPGGAGQHLGAGLDADVHVGHRGRLGGRVGARPARCGRRSAGPPRSAPATYGVRPLAVSPTATSPARSEPRVGGAGVAVVLDVLERACRARRRPRRGGRRTRPGSSPNVGGSSAASMAAIRPEVPAPK